MLNKRIIPSEPTLIDKPAVRSWLSKYSLEERGGYILAILFLVVCMWTLSLFKQTLISVFEASKLFVGLGLLGFSIAFMLKKALNIGLLDGLYYNVFCFAPLTFALILWFNQTCTDSYTENYKVIKYTLYGSSYAFDLEDQAYKEFWRIRKIQIESRPTQSAHVEFTFCDGRLGYKVLKDCRLY